MKKGFLLLLLALGTVMPLLAQQDAQFSQYMFNQLYLNPSTAGIDSRYMHFNLLHRRQWVGYSPTFDDGGAPTSTLASFSMPINAISSGIGLHFINDALGPLSSSDVQISFAHHIALKKGRLSLGARGGLYNQSIDFGKFRFNDPGDPLLESRGRENQFVPDFALGANYSTDKFFMGLGLNHLLQPSFDYGTIIGNVNALERTYTVLGGGNIDLSPTIMLSPSAIVKTNLNNVFSYEASLLASYQQKYYAGVSFRDAFPTNDLIFLVGAHLAKDQSLSIGYAFDYVITGVQAKAATSHEIRIGYRLPAPKKPEIPVIRTPRFRFE